MPGEGTPSKSALGSGIDTFVTVGSQPVMAVGTQQSARVFQHPGISYEKKRPEERVYLHHLLRSLPYVPYP